MTTAIITFENAPVQVEIVRFTKDNARFLARTLEGKQIGWFDASEVILTEEQLNDVKIQMELGYGHPAENEAPVAETPAKEDHKTARGQRIATVAFLLQTTELTDKQIIEETGVNQKFVSNVRCMLKYPNKYTMIKKHIVTLDADVLNEVDQNVNVPTEAPETSEETETKSEE